VDQARARALVGYRDISARLAQLDLAPESGLAVLVPSRSFPEIERALDEYQSGKPSLDGGRMLPRRASQALLHLRAHGVIDEGKHEEIAQRNATARESAQAAASRSMPELRQPESSSQRTPSERRSNQSTPSSGQPATRGQPPAAANPLSMSALSTDSADMLASQAGMPHRAIDMGDAGQQPNPRSGFAQFRASRYWPQSGVSWLFLTSVPMQVWGAVEYILATLPKMSNPAENKSLRAYQMLGLIPLGLLPAMMYIYLRMNRDTIAERRAPPEGVRNQANPPGNT
jgi:hypothetical protein